MIYFDSAATTLQKPESVYAAVQRTMRAAPRQRSCSTPRRSRSFSP